MANHGYTYTKKELDIKDVSDNVNKINNEMFCGHLNINNNDGHFHIQIPELGNTDSIVFWISDEIEYGYTDKNDEYITYENEKLICSNSVLEFRHGGGSAIRWWLEGVFREGLADIYDGEVGDDGYEEREKAKTQHYKTFETYLNHNIWMGKEWEWLKKEKMIGGKLTLEKSMNDFHNKIESLSKERTN